MIYLYGIAPGWYRPLWPAYAHFLEDELACRVLAKKRLHQDAFRHHVIGAYE